MVCGFKRNNKRLVVVSPQSPSIDCSGVTSSHVGQHRETELTAISTIDDGSQAEPLRDLRFVLFQQLNRDTNGAQLDDISLRLDAQEHPREPGRVISSTDGVLFIEPRV